MLSRALPASMRHHAAFVVAVLFFFGMADVTARAGASEPQPNLVFVLLDDVGWGDLGAFGGDFVSTPRLDQIAAEGMILRRYYANGAVCSPTRAAILTGRYPIEFGLRQALEAGSARGVPGDVPTLAERLRDAGYATGHFGKWHVGSARPEQLPPARGFDRSVAWLEGPGSSYLDPPLSSDGAPPVVTPGHLTNLITDAAIDFIGANADRPFFANVWHSAAHLPLEPTGFWASRYPATQQGKYAALISHADEQIGRILDLLDELGIDQRTLVVVSSDNGSIWTSIDSNGGLRGVKAQMTEGGIRVPAIARWPGRIAPGTANDSLAVSFDWLPTFAEILGLDVSDLELRGRSLRAALLDGALLERDETLFWENTDPRPDPPADTEWKRYAVRSGRFKLVQQFAAQDSTPSLYDLEADPAETVDLAATHPETAARLEAEYRDWRRKLSRFEPAGVDLTGAATLRDGSFSFAGGVATLAADDRFLVDDGEFGFRAWLTPETIGPSLQMIAQLWGSWRLFLDAQGRLNLVVRGSGLETQTTLTSAAPLLAGTEHAIAFTIHDWKNLPTNVRLYVDGELVQESNEIPAVNVSLESVRLGNAAYGTPSPLHGRLRDPRFYLASLTPAEVRDADRDGLDDAQDNCPHARNGPAWGSCTAGTTPGALCASSAECGAGGVCSQAQEDADADGAGDACDDCIAVANGPREPDRGGRVQLDSDGDGFGNACDFDYDDDGVVGLADFGAFANALGGAWGSAPAAAEFDCDGDAMMGLAEFGAASGAWGRAPGPSGLACAGHAPCTAP